MTSNNGDGTDVDECKGGLGPCGSAEVAKTCNNIPSGYTCDCQDGYEFVNETCRGISHNYTCCCTVKCANVNLAGRFTVRVVDLACHAVDEGRIVYYVDCWV